MNWFCSFNSVIRNSYNNIVSLSTQSSLSYLDFQLSHEFSWEKKVLSTSKNNKSDWIAKSHVRQENTKSCDDKQSFNQKIIKLEPYCYNTCWVGRSFAGIRELDCRCKLKWKNVKCILLKLTKTFRLLSFFSSGVK